MSPPRSRSRPPPVWAAAARWSARADRSGPHGGPAPRRRGGCSRARRPGRRPAPPRRGMPPRGGARPPARRRAAAGPDRGEQHTHRSAEDGEDHALGEQLPHDAPRTRTEGGTHRELARPGGPASEEEVAHVEAGDDQHQQHRPEQDEELLRVSPTRNAPSGVIGAVRPKFWFGYSLASCAARVSISRCARSRVTPALRVPTTCRKCSSCCARCVGVSASGTQAGCDRGRGRTAPASLPPRCTSRRRAGSAGRAPRGPRRTAGARAPPRARPPGPDRGRPPRRRRSGPGARR